MAIELVPIRNNGELKCSTCGSITDAYVGITSIAEDITPQWGGEVMSIKSKRVLICKGCLVYMDELINSAIRDVPLLEENFGIERAKKVDKTWAKRFKDKIAEAQMIRLQKGVSSDTK